MLILLRTQVDRTDKTPVTPVAPVSAVCAAFAAQPSAYPPNTRKPDVAPTCGSIAGTANAEKGRLQANFSRGRSRKRRSRTKLRAVRAPRRSHLPAVRAVSGINEGVPKAAKNSPGALQNEKSPPFQGKQRGSNEKYEVNTEKW